VKKPFSVITVVLLALLALFQLLRFVMGWEIVVEGKIVPVWASGVVSPPL
jgi:hypothetical protein